MFVALTGAQKRAGAKQSALHPRHTRRFHSFRRLVKINPLAAFDWNSDLRFTLATGG
jgi:hypothetical protein